MQAAAWEHLRSLVCLSVAQKPLQQGLKRVVQAVLASQVAHDAQLAPSRQTHTQPKQSKSLKNQNKAKYWIISLSVIRMSTSQMLEHENKKMEEKLKVVQDLMN